MPLFGSKKETTTSRVSTQPPAQKSGGLFGHRRSDSLSPDRATTTTTTTTSSNGLSNLLHRREDPSISTARDRVIAAEKAERDADLALQQARMSVRTAREHVRKLELEAEAEAKAAKIKQSQARDLGKRTKPLGRKSSTRAALQSQTSTDHVSRLRTLE